MKHIPRWVRAIEMGYEGDNVPKVVMEQLRKKREKKPGTVKFDNRRVYGTKAVTLAVEGEWDARRARTELQMISVNDHHDNEAPLIGTEVWMARQLDMENDILEGKYTALDTCGNEPVRSNMENSCHYMEMTYLKDNRNGNKKTQQEQVLDNARLTQTDWKDYGQVGRHRVVTSRWTPVGRG